MILGIVSVILVLDNKNKKTIALNISNNRYMIAKKRE